MILDDTERGAPTQDFAVPTASIREVEEAINADEVDLGTSNQHPRAKDEAEDVEMVDDDVDAGTNMDMDVSPKREPTASPSPTPKKRLRSRNTKPSVTENGSGTPDQPALTERRTHSRIEVVVPPRPDYASSREDNASARVKRSTSHIPVASESPVPTKKSNSAKVKTPGRKSVATANVEEEEEEPVSTKRAPLKRAQKRKRDEPESEEEHEQPEKPTPGSSKHKPTQSTKATQRRVQDSSPPPTPVDGAPSRGRRSAAQRADEKLKDIMPDVINFEKQMKRGTVIGEWERVEKEQERADKKAKEKEKLKENAGEKVKERAKRRRSDVRYGSSELLLQPGRLNYFNSSTKEEEEEEDDEPSTSKPAGAGVHIMTTKVQVLEDTKKVRSTSRHRQPLPNVGSMLTTTFRL